MKRKRVAILGVSFRLPGSTRDRFWSDLLAGKNLITQVPPDRWAQESYWHPRKSNAGTSYTFAAGTLGDVFAFDADFFGISPREATQMDPQQRLLLELSWEAFEDAGIRPSSVRGSRCGVYIGISSTDYSYRWTDDLAAVDSTSATGNTSSIAANRISYIFDLRGPSMALDTACSSSLFAFHQACQSICAGESEAAIAGGIGLHLHPFGFVAFSKASMLSRRGICNVFDEAGDGYVRSEGGGIFLLKDLDAALADGDRILAVVAGSGVNSDGKTSSLAVPSPEAQAGLLQDVYRRAGIEPSALDYLEAHGTGTAVGDPIETYAIGQALARHRARTVPLPIGSVKSNVGHLEAASGVAGLVKALLCLTHRQVPPTIHLRAPNPRIKLDEWNLRIITETLPLHPTKQLVIGVNSFGFGGANAHVILQSPPPRLAAGRLAAGSAGSVAPIILSARSGEALRAAAGACAAHLRAHPEQQLYDIAYNAAFRRDWHEHRAVVEGVDGEVLAQTLSAFAGGANVAEIATGSALAKASATVFVYSGNGSQWAGMGRVLLGEEPVFRYAVAAVDAIFIRHADYSVLAELQREGPDRLQYAEFAQPTLFALQVGLTELLRHWGIAPAAVVGHSVGEVTAAWASGALTLEQAVHVIHERSKQQGTRKGAGVMSSAGLAEGDVRGLLERLGLAPDLAVAAINSPRNVTLAGERKALEKLETELARRKIFHRRLDLDYAFHSAAMDPVRAAVETNLADLCPGQGRLPFYSTVTGDVLAGEGLDAEYWWRNIREPVQFGAAIRRLIEAGFSVFVEIGPHAILRNYINDCLRSVSAEGRAITTMLRSNSDRATLRRTLHQIVIAGAPVNLNRIFPVPGQWVDLPHYAWQREPYCHSSTSEGYSLVNRRKEHPLLGYRLRENVQQWENHLDTTLYPIFRDHVVGETAVFPAAGFVEMALGASTLIHGGEGHEIEELEIRAPLLLDDAQSKVVRFSVDHADGSFSIRSRPRLSSEPWTIHVVGRLLGAPVSITNHGKSRLPRRAADITGPDHYALAASVGLAYGPAFQAVSRVWVQGDTVVARLDAPEGADKNITRACLQPCFVDAGFQLLIDLLCNEVSASAGAAFVPIRVGRVRLHQAHREVVVAQAKLKRRSPRSLVADFEFYDVYGAIVATLEEVRFRGVYLKRAATDNIRYLSYQLVPRPHTADQERAPLPPIADLAAFCAARLHAPDGGALRRRHHSEVEPLLDMLCAAFAERALRRLAGDNAVIEAESLIASGTVTLDRQPFLTRLIQMLHEDGVIEPAEGGWRWSPLSDLPDADESWVTLLGDYPDDALQLIPVGRIGLHLADILAGSEDAASVALSRDDGHAFARLFAGSPLLADVGQALAGVVRLALQRLPAGRRLRILELTPCLSELAPRVLPAVDPVRCDYVIGCMRQSALDEYEGQSDRFTDTEVRLLRIDLTEAGQDAGGLGLFDIVIAGDGLIGAHDADLALANLSRIMANDGALVLLAQYPSRWMDLLLGTDPAWWAAAADGPRSPLRAPAEWAAMLHRHGLSSPTIVPELPDLGTSGAYLLITSREAQETAPGPSATEDASTWIFIQDKTGYSAALGASVRGELRALGHQVIEISPEADNLETMEFVPLLGAARDTYGEITGVVHLLGLDPESTASGAQAMLERQSARCASVARLLQACSAIGIKPACWLVTTGATGGLVPDVPGGGARNGQDIADAALWGFGRSAANEFPDLQLRLVDCAEPDQLERMTARLVRELVAPDREDEIVLTAAGRYAMRLASLPPPVLPDKIKDLRDIVRLDFTVPGPLKNLAWCRDRLRVPATGEVEIEVRAAGLNFRDVMYAMGLLSDEAVENGFAGPTMGMDVAGVVTRVGHGAAEFSVGDEVIAFAPASFATRVVTTMVATVAKPPEWSFEAAATVPTTFFTAYYALHHLARLQEGDRVLIHGAAGGVGIAAIQIAKLLGAVIFATAGSPEKRDFLRLLGADHVLDSRSHAFADDVLGLTRGVGVDAVLNSLAGEAINRNLRVLKPFGRFLELGKRDFYENTYIGLRPFRNNIAYFGIDADQLMRERPDLTHRLFGELMELFAQGKLKPLPYRAFPAAQAIDAYRYMQQSRQIGKVVLSFREGVVARQAQPAVKPALLLPSDATYLVTGGLSGFGLSSAHWLAARGARHLVLLGRRGSATPQTQDAIAALEAAGATVHAMACDVTNRALVAAVLAEVARTMPPLRGVIHAAMVLDDALIRSMNVDQIRNVLAPKILGARHLDELTRNRALDFFVLYSSATTLFGNPGQANYVAANVYLEAIARARRAAGRPALCVGWGPIADVGYLARNQQIKESLQARMGGDALSSDTVLEVLETLLVSDARDCGVLDFDWATLRRVLPAAQSPRFEELTRHADDKAESGQGLEEIKRWLEQLGPEELKAQFTDLLRKEVGQILCMPPERLDVHRSLYELGMDSLMGVELVTAVEGRFGINLPIMALSEGPTIERLVERLIRMFKGHDAAPEDGDTQAFARQVAAQYAGTTDGDLEQEVADLLAERERNVSRAAIRK